MIRSQVAENRARAFAFVAALVLGTAPKGLGAQRTAAVREQGVIAVRAAPEDKHAYVSWSDIPGAEYTVRWRSVGAKSWTEEPASARTQLVLPDLENARAYEVQVVASIDRRVVARSTSVTVTPRIRSECSAGPNALFCSVAVVRDYLLQFAQSPFLLCGTQVIESFTLDMPDCWYRSTVGHIALNRYFERTYTPPATHLSAEQIRRVARHAIWPRGDPFEDNTGVPISVGGPVDAGTVDPRMIDSAAALFVDYSPLMKSRMTWFHPKLPIVGLYAIYYEGHGFQGVIDGHDVIEWLLARGWQVIVVDQPLMGANSADRVAPLLEHEDLQFQVDGRSPMDPFLLPVKALVDSIAADAKAQDDVAPRILMIGRSGGGSMGSLYAMLDSRITANANISGGAPESNVFDLSKAAQGDFEQLYTPLLDVVSRDQQLLAGGTKGSFFYYSSQDPCCFRYSAADSWVSYLQTASTSWNKLVRVALDNAPRHGLSASGFQQLENFLQSLGLGRAVAPAEETPVP